MPFGKTYRLDDIKAHVDALAALVEDLSKTAHDARFERVELIRSVRAARSHFFPKQYFSDPAWDILLDLKLADLEGRGLPATHIGLDVGIPLSTVLRYLKIMEKDGYVRRETDSSDSRRSIAHLTDKGRQNVDRVLNIKSRAPSD